MKFRLIIKYCIFQLGVLDERADARVTGAGLNFRKSGILIPELAVKQALNGDFFVLFNRSLTQAKPAL